MPRKFHQIVIMCLWLAGEMIPASALALTFPTSKLHIGPQAFTIEEASTPEQMEYGLMFRTSLAADHGMLFLFPAEQPIAMWMKNTLISLDMLFIDAKGRILYIAENTTPESENIIRPMQPAKAVLELAGGACKKFGIHVGDQVQHAAFRASSHP